MSEAEAPVAGSESGEEVERAARSRLAVQVESIIAPVIEAQRKTALQRAFSVLDRGEAIPAELALAVVLELYAIDRLSRGILRSARRL
jgi:hypothetical protein